MLFVRSSLDNTCSACWSAAINDRRVVGSEVVEPCRTCAGCVDRNMSVGHCAIATSTSHVSSHALHDRVQALVRLLRRFIELLQCHLQFCHLVLLQFLHIISWHMWYYCSVITILSFINFTRIVTNIYG